MNDDPADAPPAHIGQSRGTLYVCATPIGNLEDVTLRVLRVLREVELVAAEDTRITRKLLAHYDIHTPMVSYRAHGERERASMLTDRLARGENIALVSDAGTPILSDPGAELVRQATDAKVRVEALPGASACLAAAMSAGLPVSRFTFEGFLPVKGPERRRRVESWRAEGRTVIFYEAPHRIARTLGEMAEWVGEARVSVGRELTKRHEEWFRGSIAEAAAHVSERRPRGEYVIVVDPAGSEGACAGGGRPVEQADREADNVSLNEDQLRERVRRRMSEGVDKKEAIRRVARETGLPKKRVYAVATEISAKS